MMPVGGDEEQERWLAIRTGSFTVVLMFFALTVIQLVQGNRDPVFGPRTFVTTAISVLVFAVIAYVGWRRKIDDYRRERQARIKAGAELVYNYRVRIGWFTGLGLTIAFAIVGAAVLLGAFGPLWREVAAVEPFADPDAAQGAVADDLSGLAHNISAAWFTDPQDRLIYRQPLDHLLHNRVAAGDFGAGGIFDRRAAAALIGHDRLDVEVGN